MSMLSLTNGLQVCLDRFESVQVSLRNLSLILSAVLILVCSGYLLYASGVSTGIAAVYSSISFQSGALRIPPSSNPQSIIVQCYDDNNAYIVIDPWTSDTRVIPVFIDNGIKVQCSRTLSVKPTPTP